MSNIRNSAFRKHTESYDEWFDRNVNAYESELNLLKKLGIHGKSVEIGSGTGKFAYPLGIRLGVEPTEEMYKRAEQLGIDNICGTAENLPLISGFFDWALMVTTICFVNDEQKALKEMHRILVKGGHAAVAFVDKETELGRKYLEKKDKSVFYHEAKFFSTEEVLKLMHKAGFKDIRAMQTLKDTSMQNPEQPSEGYGEGGFVCVYGRKP